MWDENREGRRGDFVPESHQRRATLSEKPETLDSGWDYVDEQDKLNGVVITQFPISMNDATMGHKL